MKKETRVALADASAGMVGSLASMLAFYPLDVLKTNLQVSGNSFSSQKQTKKGDSEEQEIKVKITKLFRGVHYKTGHTIASSFCYFYLYSWIQSQYLLLSRRLQQVPPEHIMKEINHEINYKQSSTNIFSKLLISAVAAMMNTCFTLPLDVLSTKHQASGTKNITSDTYKVKSLWRGLWPSLILCSNPSIHFTVYDMIKNILLKKRKRHNNSSTASLSMTEAFVVGLIAKFVATIITYPLIRAKVQLMVNNPDTSGNEKKSECNEKNMTAVLYNTWKNENGLKGLYKGCNLQLLHTLLKSAFLMMVREEITFFTRWLFNVGDEAKLQTKK